MREIDAEPEPLWLLLTIVLGAVALGWLLSKAGGGEAVVAAFWPLLALCVYAALSQASSADAATFGSQLAGPLGYFGAFAHFQFLQRVFRQRAWRADVFEHRRDWADHHLSFERGE